MSQTSPVTESVERCDNRFGLLPCPFCGSPARTDLLPHAQGPGWVQCSSCECGQHMSDTLEEAVVRWNTRSSVLAQQAKLPDRDAIYRAIESNVRSEADKHFIDRRWMVGINDAVDAILAPSDTSTASHAQRSAPSRDDIAWIIDRSSVNTVRSEYYSPSLRALAKADAILALSDTSTDREGK